MRKLLEQQPRRPMIGGHRGCVCDAPENSIEAMREGMRRGADYLEIDIQLTADGVPVVFHDVRLEQRHAPLHGYIHEMPLTLLRQSIPGLCTLREALDWGRQENVYFALELKTIPLDMQPHTLRLVELVAAMLRETHMLEQVFVFGQDYQTISHLHRTDPSVPLGLIVPFVPEDPVALMERMHALVYLSYVYNMTPEIVRSLQENGFYVSGAILREEKWVRRAQELGVNMFESDDPQKYRNSLTNMVASDKMDK